MKEMMERNCIIRFRICEYSLSLMRCWLKYSSRARYVFSQGETDLFSGGFLATTCSIIFPWPTCSVLRMALLSTADMLQSWVAEFFCSSNWQDWTRKEQGIQHINWGYSFITEWHQISNTSSSVNLHTSASDEGAFLTRQEKAGIRDIFHISNSS